MRTKLKLGAIMKRETSNSNINVSSFIKTHDGEKLFQNTIFEINEVIGNIHRGRTWFKNSS